MTTSIKKTIKRQREFAKPIVVSAMLAAFLLAGFPETSISQTTPGQPYSYSMFGNPMCSEWPGMNADAKFAWTSGFLSILSMGHETSRRAGQQKFKDQQGIDAVVEVINQHCANYPQAQASEAAAPYLNP
jgi:hypothetical protein